MVFETSATRVFMKIQAQQNDGFILIDELNNP